MTKETTEFNLATADKHQLKKFAEKTYDMALTLNMSEDTMRRHIQDHRKENNLELPKSEVLSKRNSAEKKITIHIPASEKEGGSDPVFLGINGFGYTLPRGIDMEVSESVVEVLNNAVQDIVTQRPDGELLHRDVVAHPFQISQSSS